MNRFRMPARLTGGVATAGVATALVAGGLVAAAPAQATPVPSSYTCTFLSGPQTVDFAVEAPSLGQLPSVPAGMPVLAGFLNLMGDHAVDIDVTLPPAVVEDLEKLGQITAIDADGLEMGFGDSAVPAEGLALTGAEPQEDGSLLMHATATNGAFTVPAAGTHEVTMPAEFTMVPTITNGSTSGAFEIPCHTDAPASLGAVTVSKSDSTTTAAAKPKKVAKGKRGKVVVDVLGGEYVSPAGKAVALEGKKKVGKGKVTDGHGVIKLAKLKPGKHKLTVKYLGDGYTDASQAAEKVLVKVTKK